MLKEPSDGNSGRKDSIVKPPEWSLYQQGTVQVSVHSKFDQLFVDLGHLDHCLHIVEVSSLHIVGHLLFNQKFTSRPPAVLLLMFLTASNVTLSKMVSGWLNEQFWCLKPSVSALRNTLVSASMS